MLLSKYPVKIILLLELAVYGNIEPLMWLMENDYPELAAFANAIRKDKRAYEWLINNGYPDLAALTDAIEDNYNAYMWLKKHKRDFYIILADAVQPKDYAVEYLRENNLEIFLRLCVVIKAVKDQQAEDATDPHKASPFY